MDSPAPKAKMALTEREHEILQKAWSCMKSEPEVDYAKLAEECGMTNPRSAGNAWRNIKNKLFVDLPAAGADGAAPSTPNASPRKRKAPAKIPKAKDSSSDDNNENNNDGGEGGSPAKKARTPARGRAKKQVKSEVVVEKEESPAQEQLVSKVEGEEEAGVI